MIFTESVEYIRQTYFPDWDRRRSWQIVQVDDLDGRRDDATEDRGRSALPTA